MNSTDPNLQQTPLFSSIDSEEYLRYVESIQSSYSNLMNSGNLRDLEQLLLNDIQVARTMNDTIRGMEQSLRLGIVYLRLGEWEVAELMLSVLRDRVESMNQPLLYGRVVGTLGDLYRMQCKVFDAFESMQTALVIFRELGNQQLEAVVLGNIACLLVETNRSNDAEPFFMQAIQLSNKMGDLGNEMNHSINYSKVLLRKGKLYEAKKLLTTCLLQMQNQSMVHMEAIATSNLAMVLDQSDEWMNAKPMFLKALELFRTTDNVRMEGITLNNLADFEWKHGDVMEARSRIQQAIDLMEPLKDSRALAISYLLQSEIEEWEGDLSYAIASLTKGIEYAQLAQNQHLLAQAYVNRGLLYEELGWFREAENEMEWTWQYVTETNSDELYEIECDLMPYLVRNHKWEYAEKVYQSICATHQSRTLFADEMALLICEFIYLSMQKLVIQGAEELMHSLTPTPAVEPMDWHNWFSNCGTPPLFVYWNHIILLAKIYGMHPRTSSLRSFLKARNQLIRFGIPTELIPVPMEWDAEPFPPLL